MIDRFDLKPGVRMAGKYDVDSFIGGGWEGEVYKVVEAATGLTRAAKLFFPHRNEGNRAVKKYALKLDRLREVPSVVQYHSTEVIRKRGQAVTCLVSEFIDGVVLEKLIKDQPGKRMAAFEALCLVHTLTQAVEQVHEAGEYHGDLHSYNILVARSGVRFVPHIVDFFDRGSEKRHAREDDVVDLVHMLYHAVGGKTWYSKQPHVIKEICKGLRRDLILKRFPTAGRLRRHLESFSWE
jgi:tRNA A-37 threonylcarbamoyl transferase component Bud32